MLLFSNQTQGLEDKLNTILKNVKTPSVNPGLDYEGTRATLE